MKRAVAALLLGSALCLAAIAAEKDVAPAAQEAKDGWRGVDETVVERFAKDAGRPAREPYINTDQGDLLLFIFLIAGMVGGFIAGYCFRGLFPPKGVAKRATAADAAAGNVP